MKKIKDNLTRVSQIQHSISEFFTVPILRTSLLKETDVSYLYIIELSNKKILVKQYKNIPIKSEYENQLIIYKIWKDHYRGMMFRIPEPYFLSETGNFFTMEYITGSNNFLELLFSIASQNNQQLPLNIGRALHEYHQLITNHLAVQKKSIISQDSMRKLLITKNGVNIKKLIDNFPEDTITVIYRDFTPSNVMLANNQIYFIDFQTINYNAPFYYDLARFCDVTRIFGFLKNPLIYLWRRRSILRILDKVIIGYGEKRFVDKNLLKSASYIHQKEHAIMKNKNKLNKFILQLLYLLNV